MTTNTTSKNVMNYNYNSIDESYISPVYKLMCVGIIENFPISMSPNVITIYGLLCVMLSSIIYVSNDFLKLTNVELGFIFAFALFAYQLFDTLDGMQGARVGMYYNPTTELFDHGIDSIVTALTCVNLLYFSGLIYAYPFASCLIYFVSFMNFYFPTWEHSNTGTMFFRKGITNPTETLFFSQILFVFCGYFKNFFVNDYIVLGLVVFMLIITGVNLYKIVSNTFLSHYTSSFNVMLSLLPMFFNVILFLMYLENGFWLYIMLNLISVVNLIWMDISKENFDVLSEIFVFAISVVNLNIGTFFAFGTYLILFHGYVKKMCEILGMKNFYDVPAK